MALFRILTPDFAVVTSRTHCGRTDQLCSSAMNKKLCNIALQKKVGYTYIFISKNVAQNIYTHSNTP